MSRWLVHYFGAFSKIIHGGPLQNAEEGRKEEGSALQLEKAFPYLAHIRGFDIAFGMDIVYEILSRVDPPTLAIASCVNSDFRSISADEKLWEKACSLEWPSTKDPHVKHIVSSLGGYRTFYSMCYPLILHSPVVKPVDRCETSSVLEELSMVSVSDFVSIIDVVFKDLPFYSKVVEGIPGADDLYGWFSHCPFRIDLFNAADNEDDQMGRNNVTIDIKDGNTWNALWENLRVSWILVNKKTKKMANLASSRPLTGRRHWPDDSSFVLYFGSILPGHRLLSCKAVQCNIAMRCKFSSVSLGEQASILLRITELSLQLQDLVGSHLNGQDSLLILEEALNCRRSKNYDKVLNSYHHYSRLQLEMKEKEQKSECCLQVVFIVCWIAGFISLCCAIFW